MHNERRHQTSVVGRAFAIIAFIEAGTWTGLLIGMFLKHVTNTTDLGVTVFGLLHGIAFMVYGVVAIVAAYVLRWPWKVTVVSLIAAVPPLTTIPMERWLARRGLLSALVASRGSDKASVGAH